MLNHLIENNLLLIILFVWILLLTGYIFCNKSNENKNEILNKGVPIYGTGKDFTYIKL